MQSSDAHLPSTTFSRTRASQLYSSVQARVFPRFMNIPGEQSLRRILPLTNTSQDQSHGRILTDSRTPIMRAKKAVIVGGGNVAMDAARTAKRLGSEVHVVYRRSEEELHAGRSSSRKRKASSLTFSQTPSRSLLTKTAG